MKIEWSANEFTEKKLLYRPYSGGSFGEERGLKVRDQSTVLRKLRGRELYPRLARFHGKEKSGYQAF